MLLTPVFSQNLIPNGDFELGPNSSSGGWTKGIWDTTGGSCIPMQLIQGPDFWTVVKGSPDRMVNGDIPCNWDNDTAATGNAYIVIGSNETGMATLITQLEKDSIYKLSYYVSLNTFRGLSTQPCQFYFNFNNSNDSIFSPIISDIKWLYVDTIFIANENASKIEISGTYSSPFNFSAANIDKIYLEKTKMNSINNFYANQIKIYPIPTTDKIYFNYLPQNIKQITINNLSGQTIYNYNQIINNSIDLSFLQNGLYLLIIETSNNIITKKITVLK